MTRRMHDFHVRDVKWQEISHDCAPVNAVVRWLDLKMKTRMTSQLRAYAGNRNAAIALVT